MFYNKRVKILVTVTGLLMLIPIFRLAQLQLFSSPSYLAEIERLQQGSSQQTQTIRGRILDRNGLVIASEEPLFKLYVTYSDITRYADPNVQQAMRLSAKRQKTNPNEALAEVDEDIEKGLERIAYLMALCEDFGFSAQDMEQTIRSHNSDIWDRRVFQAWRNNCRTSPLYLEFQDKIGQTPGDLARADFQRHFPVHSDRILLVSDPRYDILEMLSFFPLVELQSDEDQFLALTALEGMKGVEVTAQASRDYPYKTVASQVIGWVGPATQEPDLALFKHDRLAKYLDGELCGREDGIERVCEPILRGRRGELTYNIDRNLVDRTEPNFGQDVQLTLDIELQQDLEDYLITYDHRPCCQPGKAAVIIDVQSGDILALVSVPVYDLNTARYEYGRLVKLKELDTPLRNRAINKNYPPGSVAKPLVAIAGLEAGTYSLAKTLSCPSTPPPPGWPKCWIQKQEGVGHDVQWSNNNARNAIKGSCNLYFSHLAHDMDLRTLQTWFSRFGYGRAVPLTAPLEYSMHGASTLRSLGQAPGQIISQRHEKRLAGIGQSNMRVTPLQVANSMATLARGGRFVNPTLFLNASGPEASRPTEHLGISPSVLQAVIGGMDAVVNETNGTANAAFEKIDFSRYGVHVYGKTGSTEAPEVAWFAGFATDRSGDSLAIALVVEGGQSGSTDASPLGRDILQICIKRGYLGTFVE